VRPIARWYAAQARKKARERKACLKRERGLAAWDAIQKDIQRAMDDRRARLEARGLA